MKKLLSAGILMLFSFLLIISTIVMAPNPTTTINVISETSSNENSEIFKPNTSPDDYTSDDMDCDDTTTIPEEPTITLPYSTETDGKNIPLN